jgi:hypothetical protein
MACDPIPENPAFSKFPINGEPFSENANENPKITHWIEMSAYDKNESMITLNAFFVPDSPE